MNENSPECTEAQMLIRKPAREVFDAFIDPSNNKKFLVHQGERQPGNR